MESAKFFLYLSLPIFAMVVYADPVNMTKIINATNFVKYPKESPRPPIGKDLLKHDGYKKGREERAVEKKEMLEMEMKIMEAKKLVEARNTLMEKVLRAREVTREGVREEKGKGDSQLHDTPKKGWLGR